MERELYPLTNPQKSIYLTEEYFKGSNINNIAGTMMINAPVNFDKFTLAIKQAIKQNDSCRIKIKNVSGEVKQWISDYEDFPIDIIDVTSVEELSNITKEIASKPFPLYDSYLFHFVIFRFPNQHGGFIVNIHHLISDSWTLGILVNEIIGIYSSYLDGKDPILKDSSLYSYRNYIVSENEYQLSDKFQKDKSYWDDIFDTIPDNATVPSTFSNINVQSDSIVACREQLSIPSNLLVNIKDYCTKYRVSVFNFLMAVFSIYISRVSLLDDFCIGTPILNRTNFKEKNTTGMFINTLPLRVKVDNSVSFQDFLSSISSSSMALLRHQKYAYQSILEDLREKQSNLPSLYQIMISYQITKMLDNQDQIPHESTWYFNGTTADDIDIHIFDFNDTNELSIAYDYQINKYTSQDMKQVHFRILAIISQILENENILLYDIETVTSDEKKQILKIFNDSYVSHPRDISVYTLIEQIANKFPDKVAIVDDTTSITYANLIKRSYCIAQNLVKRGIKRSDCVSILFPKKSIDLICCMLGILKAGACFLAVYPDYPMSRITYMLENSHTKLLLTNYFYKDTDFDVPILCMEDLEVVKNSDFPVTMNDDNAYIIYTSGSTGKPKGTVQSHNNLINFVYSFQHFFQGHISSDDNMISVTNISFDVSIAEIFTPLFYGATLFLYKDLNTSGYDELVRYIIENKITFAYFPPSMLQSIYEELKKYENVPLNKLLVGVEPIKAHILQDYLSLNSDMRIINGYGPSETTICCTMYPFNKEIPKDDITPIGVPIGNSKVLILDKAKKLLPIGCVGEIYVQGECVGNGYLYNEEATKEKFDLVNRVYKTGDLAKLLPDGNILFVGRDDNQVKYRGYRIDLGEIEHGIKMINTVKNCVVLLDKRNSDNPILIAFIVPKNNDCHEDDIRKLLISILPHYMIPNQFIFLDHFSLTPNGKIDKKCLLDLFDKKDIPFVAPSTELEKTLAKLWGDVLQKKKIGINDNFFEIGGDSLDAIKIVALAKQKGISLSAQNFYTYPTISLLIKHCLIEHDKTDSDVSKYLPMISINKSARLPLDGDILLVGATGFLGSHILYELLHQTNFIIYCLIRGKSRKHSEERLKTRLACYFGNQLDSYFGNRIIVINGDFCKSDLGITKNDANLLFANIKTVINCAAIVKHVGNYDYFHNINVVGVENLISFCKKCNNAHLVHVSTLSVAGSYSKGKTSFSEKDLYIGQNVDENVYIKTKFEAEQLLAHYIEDGFCATIFRLGNITWRSNDGVFQVNESENLFFTLIDFMIQTKKLPTSLKNFVFNISPVNECANLMIRILLEGNDINVYHIYNFHSFYLSDIVKMLDEIGFSIEFDDSVKLQNILEKQLSRFPYVVDQLSSSNPVNNVEIAHQLTSEILNQLSFNWNDIDCNYMKKKLGGV